MTNEYDRDPSPHEAQRNGQSAISQDNPLRELHQEGDAADNRPAVSRATAAELSCEEVSVLCDIERDGSAKSTKQSIVERLIELGYVIPSAEPLRQAKLTALGQQSLSKRGVGLNES